MTMRKFQEPTFEDAEVGDILVFTKDFKDRGYTFVNINCTTVDDGVEVLYAFRAPKDAKGVTGKIVQVPDGTHLPSITDYYPEAFVFENEARDLFGVTFDGLSIDYDGEFYTLSMTTPMNPHSVQAKEAPQNGGLA